MGFAEHPKKDPRAAKSLQERPTCPQERPKSDPSETQEVPRSPRDPPELAMKPLDRPRPTHESPRAPKSVQELMKNMLPFWTCFCPVLGSLWKPFGHLLFTQTLHNTVQDAFKAPPDRPKRPPDLPPNLPRASRDPLETQDMM